MHKSSLTYNFKILIFALIFLMICSAFIFISAKAESDFIPSFFKADFADKKIKIHTVIIDAGHGGKDAGTSSKSGIKEKDINLSIAQKLGELLRLHGIETVFTRESDELCISKEKLSSFKLSDLKGRVEIAEQYPDSIFISIHQNALPIEKYYGMQVFYSSNDPSSQILAEKIQKENKTFLQRENKREIKKAGSNIFVLDRIKSPAVLVECGFLSNEKEAELLNSSEYQDKIAFIIAESVLSFINDASL